MDVFSEIEIEALVEEAYGLEPTEVPSTGDMVASEAELEALTTFLDGAQNFDPFELEWLDGVAGATQVIDPDAADWLADFMESNVEINIIADTEDANKPIVTFIEDTDDDDDDVDPGVISWGMLISLTGSFSTFTSPSTIGTSFDIDGDVNTGLDGTQDGTVDDEVIATGTRVTFDRSDVFILRGLNGGLSYHHNGVAFDNEGDWLNSLYDELIQIMNDISPIIGRPAFPIGPGMSLDLFEALPVATRRAVLEHFIGDLPQPG